MAKHYSKLKAEIRAQWRRRAQEEYARRGQPLPSDFQVSQPGDGDLNPPDAKRVARRACCLAAVALRGLAGTWDHKDQMEFLPRLRDWVEQSSIAFELERHEYETIQAPPSELDRQSMIDACWRWEGAAVLNAALGRHPLPPHDETVDTELCGKSAGLLLPEAKLSAQIEQAALDSRFDRFSYADQVLALHWRLRQFVQIEQKAIDFSAFARGVQWADFNLNGVPQASGDLAIAGLPISEAPEDLVHKALSIASERHTAANWLIGWSELYSEVETPT